MSFIFTIDSPSGDGKKSPMLSPKRCKYWTSDGSCPLIDQEAACWSSLCSVTPKPLGASFKPQASNPENRTHHTRSPAFRALGMPSNPANPQAKSKKQTQTATEIREAEYKTFLEATLTTHAGYLSKPILALSTSLALSIQNIAEVLALLVLILHVLTPTYLLPHLSALITLVIPVQNTLHSLALDQQRDPNGSRDSSQWLAYWVCYAFSELARGWMAVWRPGWKGAFEISRSIGLVTIAGPWFARAALASSVLVILGDVTDE